MTAAKLMLACTALLGAFLGWLMDRDAAFIAPARIVGRIGWGALVISVLLLASGCSTTRALYHACRDGLCR